MGARPARLVRRGEQRAAEGVSPRRLLLKRLFQNRKAVWGAVFLAIVILAALLADVISPYSPYEQNLRQRLQGPSAQHWLGTDQFGRDILTRIIYGARISLTVGLVSVGIAVVLGGTMGLAAGFYGGKVENLLMRLTDVLLALPGFLLALAIVATLGPSMTNVMLAVGIAYTPGFARVMRSAVMAAREYEYVTAARAAGASDLRIMFYHLLPNCLSPLIVQATLAMAGAIMSTAGLSFLGLGAQPPTPEWGSMLNSARPFIRTAPHALSFPGLAIMLTVLSLNLLGDGLRDALDPRIKD